MYSHNRFETNLYTIVQQSILQIFLKLYTAKVYTVNLHSEPSINWYWPYASVTPLHRLRFTMAKPVTREEKENSKKEFDELIFLINQELKSLEGWILKTATPKLTNLQKLLTGDLKNADKRWECEAEIRVVKTYIKQGQTKLDYMETLVGKLNE